MAEPLRSLSEVRKGSTVVQAYVSSTSLRGVRNVSPTTVKSVGRRWITTDCGRRFDRITGCGEYGWRLFPSIEALRDLQEASELRRQIVDAMDYGRNAGTLAQLREIASMLGIVREEARRG